MCDRFFEQSHDGGVQRFSAGEFDAFGARQRMETGAVKSFIDIDVAEAPEEALI